MARIQHVTVTVPDDSLIQDALDFYRLLGGQPLIRPPMLVADTPGCWIGFGESQVHVVVGESAPGPAHFALDLGEDFEPVLERLEDSGIERRDARRLWGARRCFVRDPAGNLIELFERPPESEPVPLGN